MQTKFHGGDFREMTLLKLCYLCSGVLTVLDFRKRLMSPTSYLNINSTADLLGKCRIIGLPAAEAIGGVAATLTAVCCRCLISRCSLHCRKWDCRSFCCYTTVYFRCRKHCRNLKWKRVAMTGTAEAMKMVCNDANCLSPNITKKIWK